MDTVVINAPPPFNLRDLTPRSGVDTQRVVRPGANPTLRKTVSSAGHKAEKVLSGVAGKGVDLVKNNADFLSAFIAGGAVSFGVAVGLHRPDLAITFPMLYSIIGETIPRALVGVYQGIEHIERSRLGRPLIGIGDRGIGKDFTAAEFNKLQRGVVRRVMNGLAKTLATKTYNKSMGGVLLGGVVGAVAGGALEFSHQIQAAQAHQPAAQPVPADNDAVSRHPGGVTNPPAGGGEQPPATNPAPGSETNPNAVPPAVRPASNPPVVSPLAGEDGITLPPSHPPAVHLSPQITVEPSTGTGHVWGASENWLQPIFDNLKTSGHTLSDQVQIYFTDAVKDIMEKYYPHLQPDQTIDFASHKQEIIDYITRAVQNDLPGVASGKVSDQLKGLNPNDLNNFIDNAVPLLNGG